MLEKKCSDPFVSFFNEITSIDGHETDRRQIPIRIDKIVAANVRFAFHSMKTEFPISQISLFWEKEGCDTLSSRSIV